MRKNDRRRLLCGVLSIGMLFSMLAGCAEEIPPITTDLTTAPQETTQETVLETVPPTTEPEPLPLVMETPVEDTLETAAQVLLLKGTVDPGQTLAVNGETVQPDVDGSFAYEAQLEVGENRIRVTYLDETMEYTVQRWYTTEYYSQAEGRTYGSGACMYLEVFARTGSEVKAAFRGEELVMTTTVDQLGCGASEGFEKYIGRFDMPSDNDTQQDLGPITYTVICDGVTETFTTGDITCAARVEVKSSDPEATPQGGRYMDVGSGYIAEIIDCNVETFDGTTNDDKSYPYYNYLPEGTVDYCAQSVITDPTGERYYMLLRSGVRVYRAIKNTPVTQQSSVVDCYTGTLPDHNEIGIASLTQEDHFTYLTLDCLWKAPFFFEVEPQEYTDPSTRRYTLEHFDAGYVDITFCYATQVTGEVTIPEDHPLFSGAEWIQNESDHTLRLYLKREGGLYGWDAYYNENDQLCFKFLNPVTVTPADNAYGADLTGVRIMLDVGHGGYDVGAAGHDKYGVGWSESERNLLLSLAIRDELESIGATVIMNRTTMEETVTQRERIQFLRQQAPDYCLCIHHNSSADTTRNGYETGYFTPFTQAAADHVHAAVADTNIYNSAVMIWFYYYVSRQTACPIVLTENGFISNVGDITGMLDDEVMQQKAEALTQGIVNYYLELSGYDVKE